MILFQVRNPIARVFLILVPLIIFAVVYFTVIKPSSDTANDAVRTSTHAVSQQLKQAGADTKQAADATQSTSDAQKTADAATQEGLDTASKLTGCVAKAGTDASALADCQAIVGG